MTRTICVVAAMAVVAFTVRAVELVGAGRHGVVVDAALVALTLSAVIATAYAFDTTTR